MAYCASFFLLLPVITSVLPPGVINSVSLMCSQGVWSGDKTV